MISTAVLVACTCNHTQLCMPWQRHEVAAAAVSIMCMSNHGVEASRISWACPISQSDHDDHMHRRILSRGQACTTVTLHVLEFINETRLGKADQNMPMSSMCMNNTTNFVVNFAHKQVEPPHTFCCASHGQAKAHFLPLS